MSCCVDQPAQSLGPWVPGLLSLSPPTLLPLPRIEVKDCEQTLAADHGSVLAASVAAAAEGKRDSVATVLTAASMTGKLFGQLRLSDS